VRGAWLQYSTVRTIIIVRLGIKLLELHADLVVINSVTTHFCKHTCSMWISSLRFDSSLLASASCGSSSSLLDAT
jgi:hypothetical protein